MANTVFQRNKTLPDRSAKSDFHDLIDTATLSSLNIVNADIDPDAAIVDTKLATITTAGKVSGAALTSLASIPAGAGSIPVANGGTGQTSVAAMAASLMSYIYPVGSIYINANVATNPGTLLGFGTWTAFGAGKVMVGLNASDTDFDTAEETGGEKTHTLTTNEMPSHNHTTQSDTAYVWRKNGVTAGEGTYANSYTIQLLDSAGGDVAHNNLQPYIVVYMWKRTA